MFRSRALAIAVILCSFGSSGAQNVSNLQPSQKFEIEGSLTDDNNDVSTNVSGIACMPPAAGRHNCLVIDDESRAAQLVSIEGRRLIAGPKVPLIGDEPSASIIGQEPKNAGCSAGKAKFKDLDGEGVAFAFPYFYVLGSHGCSRKSNKFRLSSFILARFRVDREGRVVDEADRPLADLSAALNHVETTYRLAEALKRAEQVGEFFAQDLNDEDGLNLEGIAVVGDQLIAGLRAPVLKRRAFLISVSLSFLFSRGSLPAAPDVQVIPLELGKNYGVRDLAPLGLQQLLVLTGPAQEQKKVPYGIFLVDLASTKSPQFLATLEEVEEDGEIGKAEGLVILETASSAVRVGILFDGVPNGAMREYWLPIK